MRRIPLMSIAIGLALATGGCNLFGGGDTTTTTTESPTPGPVVASPTDGESPGQPTESSQTQPPPPPESPVVTLPRDLDLIPSTNPDQRVQSIQGDRNDPFSIVSTTPSVSILPSATPRTAQAPTTPGGAGTGTAAPTGRTPGGQLPGGGGSGQTPSNRTPGGLAPIPNLVPGSRGTSTAAAPSPPPPPQPTLARAVAVLGVVQIGDVPYAIVNAPNESSSRYVRVGQRLSNGQIVVKRIEMNRPEPVVVFEQFGIEVVTAVGEGGAPATSEDSTAMISPSTSQQPSG